MQLEKDERSIIAGFHSEEEAQKARNALQDLGIIDADIERTSLKPTTIDENDMENSLSGDFPGLADTVLDANMDQDSSILMGADPSVSGLSDRNTDQVGRDIILTVVVKEDQLKKAQEIVEKHGGFF